MSNPLNDFGLKIFLDRYAHKDTTKATLAVDDLVVVCTNQKTRQREVGYVQELIDNPGNKPRVRVRLLDDTEVTQDWDDVDKPTETAPEQTMARVARGIADMETTPETKQEWEDKFKWLLDSWRFVPGGRILSAAGTEQSLTYFNCFSRETLVHLDTGIVEIGTLTGTHNVLSQGGVYRPAEFKSYGFQQLWEVTLDSGDVFYATEEHEWVVSKPKGGYERVYTRDLVGRRVPINPRSKPDIDADFYAGVRNGIVYGDGTRSSQNRACVSLFGDKMSLEPYFDGFGIAHKYVPATDTYPEHIRITGLPAELKDMPAYEASSSYWRGFTCGLLATDGNVGLDGCVIISSRDEQDLSYIAKGAAKAGFVATSIRMARETSPYDGSYKPCFTLRFAQSSVVEEDILRPFHLTRYNDKKDQGKKDKQVTVRVSSVAATDRVEEVYCCVEPETHTITIGNGFLTGQCYVVPSPKDSRQGIIETLGNMMEIMSRGGGVGINLSSLRPRHNYVKGVNGRSSGSISWGGLYSFVTGLIEQGGSRRGALMLMLDVTHPDVLDFIDAKREAGKITNANISVTIPDAFMDAVQADADWNLVFPDTTHAAYNAEWDGNIAAWQAKGYPVVTHKTVKAREIWHKIAHSAWASAEPGILFSDRVNQMSNSHYFSRLICTNPCLTGDTKVALADGRGTATIRELADAGVDVDVYAIDRKGKLAVRRMRNPRVTGYQQQIYKVTIEGGHTFRTTANHKMILRDGSEKEVRKLRKGDSLWIGHRGVSTYDEAKFGSAAKTDYKYNFVKSCVSTQWMPEHRFFKQEELGYAVPTGYHVHHKNHDPLDNRLENLEVVPSQEHIDHHMLGDNNPMVRMPQDPAWMARYSANMSKATAGEANGRYKSEVSDAELLACMGELAQELGRQPTQEEWFAYGRENLGLHNITSFRLKRMGCKTTSVQELLRKATEAAGVQVIDLKSFSKHSANEIEALAQGYRTHMIEGRLHVERTCEVCGSMFIVEYRKREIASCSVECGKQLGIQRGAATFEAQAESKLDNMLKQYKALEQTLGRTPWKKEYEAHMWEQGFPCRFGGSKGLPATYKDLQEQAAVYNHKVVKVELDGFEDVYNGTVDEFHNFCIVVGTEHVEQLNCSAELMTGSVNCGEQPLPAWGICNLGAINLGVHVKDGNVLWDELEQTVRYAVRFLDNVIDATPYFIDENEKKQTSERRVGLGIMGLAEMLIKVGIRYGSDACVEFLDKLGKFLAVAAYTASSDYAAEKGSFPEFDADKLLESGYMKGMPKAIRTLVKKQGLRNVTLLTVAPTGTTGTMVDTSTGVEPYFSWTYYRKSRLGLNEIEVDIVKTWREANPGVKELPDYFVSAMELSPEEHVRTQAALQRWIDSSISKTTNAPNNYTIEQVQDMYMLLYKLGCKGGTIYRDGSRDEQVLMLKAEPAAAAEAPALDIDAEARKAGYLKPEDVLSNPELVARVLAAVGVQAAPEPVSRRRKDKIMQSINCKQHTHLGSCYTDVTYDRNNDPLEIFVRSGKAGSDVASLAEGLGRLASTLLTIPSPVPPMERLRDIAGHLEGIGGSDSVGFGKAQIKSMPDAVGKSLAIIADELDTRKGKAAPSEPVVEEAKPARKGAKRNAADICPNCGAATYIREEGCKHCTSCGHSACG